MLSADITDILSEYVIKRESFYIFLLIAFLLFITAEIWVRCVL